MIHSCHIQVHSTAFRREAQTVGSSLVWVYESKTVWETLLEQMEGWGGTRPPPKRGTIPLLCLSKFPGQNSLLVIQKHEENEVTQSQPETTRQNQELRLELPQGIFWYLHHKPTQLFCSYCRPTNNRECVLQCLCKTSLWANTHSAAVGLQYVWNESAPPSR